MINGTMENISLWKLLVFSVFLISFMSIFIKVSSRIWKLLRSNMSLMGLPNPPVDNWLNGHAAKVNTERRDDIKRQPTQVSFFNRVILFCE